MKITETIQTYTDYETLILIGSFIRDRHIHRLKNYVTTKVICQSTFKKYCTICLITKMICTREDNLVIQVTEHT